MNDIDTIFQEALGESIATTKQAALKEQKHKEFLLLQEKERQMIIRERKTQLARLQSSAEANMMNILDQKKGSAFRQYMKTIFERESSLRTGYRFALKQVPQSVTGTLQIGNLEHIEKYELVLQVFRLGSSKPARVAVESAIEIIFIIETTSFLKPYRLSQDVSGLKIEIVDHTWEARTGTHEWSRIDYVEDAQLDKVLAELSDPELAIRFIVSAFGDIDNKPEDVY